MSDPGTPVQCEQHGTSHATFVCRHLVDGVGRGFFCEPKADDPRPDAWCAHCNEVFEFEQQWTEAAVAYADVTLVCAGCYDAIREANRFVAEPPSSLVFFCSACGRPHSGEPRDFAFDAPAYWLGLSDEQRAKGILEKDICIVGEHRFARVSLELPIRGGAGPLVLRVWVSLSEQNSARLLEHWDDDRRFTEPPCFGWFSSQLPGYEDTLRLKANVYQLPRPWRPWIEIEPTEHPLARDYWEGLSRERLAQLLHAFLG